jgi:hypothetical protein
MEASKNILESGNNSEIQGKLNRINQIISDMVSP